MSQFVPLPLTSALKARIEEAIGNATGQLTSIVSTSARTGGSINQAQVVTMHDGRRYFVKYDPAALCPGMFPAERRALELILSSGAIRAPRPLVAAEDFIVMEAFDQGRQSTEWQTQLGRQLATMHSVTRRYTFGLEFDNYIGITPQPNKPSTDWVHFWRDRRLRWQLDRFAQNGNQQTSVVELGNALCDRLEAVLQGPEEPGVLLHGDLWCGNAAADEFGDPIIFDPASYYGHREAEIGMMKMFGGFSEQCFDAYQEVWPLADGNERRIAVYRLYHELNHLNMFGSAYYDRCLTTIRGLL